LSGGEKARVALASLMVRPGNLLLMDEPTNHLDLESSEALAEALATYDGTLAFVSHNRSFIHRLATRIWNVTPEGVEEYPGTFSEFMDHLMTVRKGIAGESASGGTSSAKATPDSSGKTSSDRGSERRPGGSPGKASHKGSKGAASRPEAKKDVAASGQARSAPAVRETKEEARRRRAAERGQKSELQTAQRSVSDFESRIEKLEAEQVEREKALAKPDVFDDRTRYAALLAEYSDSSTKLQELMARWEQAQEAVATLQTRN
jgi:ATP-binding cassette subfamily F protein 3